MSFAITSLGRSGTAALAKWLGNNSQGIKVVHEADNAIQYDAEKVNARLAQNNYGEVSSYLRFVFDEVQCSKKAVIIRHPYRILLSAINRNRFLTWEQWAGHINEGLVALDNYIESGVRVVRFELLTHKQPHNRNSLAEWLGIDSENLGQFTRENPTAIFNHRIVRGPCVTMLHWFANKYYGEKQDRIADLNLLEDL